MRMSWDFIALWLSMDSSGASCVWELIEGVIEGVTEGGRDKREGDSELAEEG